MKIPSMMLKQLYNVGSLAVDPAGVCFGLVNRLSDATLIGVSVLSIDDDAIPLESVTLDLGDGRTMRATDLTPETALPFPLQQKLELRVRDRQVTGGRHRIRVAFETRPFGRLELAVEDDLGAPQLERDTVPYSKADDYEPGIIRRRQQFVEQFSGVALEHVTQYSFEPGLTQGNVENFTGVAQVPIGFAGPLLVDGEHARGEFVIPLATTEGTLVASYNRGIKVLNRAGGVRCTVVDDQMQRAPVFVFESAREARAFKIWIAEHIAPIREAAQATSTVARLDHVTVILANKFAFLRFNFYTGDAAGQNMVGRATFAACSWILERVDTVRRFYLESNLATDKKSSHVNVVSTRGKRVTAEATIPRDVLLDCLRVEPANIVEHSAVANIGAILSGANNNGCHSPNAITAMFIATGQDVANVAESSAGIAFVELTPTGDLYMSLTIPSLIVATHGGGTGLATQRECLAVMGCFGAGKVNKLAEIVAGVALAGELSLASAISSLEWVSSHEKFGRNRAAPDRKP